MYTCIGVYMFICMHVHMSICMFIYICIYVYTYMCIYVYTYICIYVYMCICAYMYTCMYMYTCIYNAWSLAGIKIRSRHTHLLVKWAGCSMISACPPNTGLQRDGDQAKAEGLSAFAKDRPLLQCWGPPLGGQHHALLLVAAALRVTTATSAS